jgi:primosomal protein N' (replication factor Y) (superfamily II helicase)
VEAVGTLRLPPGAEVLGPVAVPPHERGARQGATEPAQLRMVVRVPRAHGADLSRTLVEMQGVRSARKLGTVRVQVDPVGLA